MSAYAVFMAEGSRNGPGRIAYADRMGKEVDPLKYQKPQKI
jgi:hypothetical protein